jgi:hypothetical protein
MLLSIFLFLTFHGEKRNTSNKKTRSLPGSTPSRSHDGQVSNLLRHRYKLLKTSSSLTFIRFNYLRERNAANQYLQDAAIEGGPAGGNTSYDESPHFKYRRIIKNSVPTCHGDVLVSVDKSQLFPWENIHAYLYIELRVLAIQEITLSYSESNNMKALMCFEILLYDYITAGERLIKPWSIR